MKRRYYFISLLALPLCASLLSCEKQNKVSSASPTVDAVPTANAPIPSLAPTLATEVSPLPASSPTPSTKASATPVPSPTPTIKITPTNTPIPKPTEPPTTPTPTPPLDPKISYRGIIVDRGEITLYISEDPAHPQVVVRKKGGNFQSFVWDYNLAYGEPIIYTEENPENLKNLGFSGENEMLAIWLPTEPLEESTYPYGEELNPVEKICGEGHFLSLQDLSDAAPNTLKDTLIAPSTSAGIFQTFTVGYTKDQDTVLGQETDVFSVFSEDGTVLQQYPMLCLPTDKEYPAIYGKIHVNEHGTIYQKFGFEVDGIPVWLGQYIDGRIFCWQDYLLKFDAQHEPYVLPWWPRKLVDEGENTWLDLDGDGTAEQISYQLVPTGSSNYMNLLVSINGVEHDLALYSDLEPVLYTACLDGKTWQIIALDYGVGRSNDWVLSQYKNSKLNRSGYFVNGSYRKLDDAEGNIYISKGGCYMFQHNTYVEKQEFSDGILTEIARDYYEFLPAYWMEMDEATHRNIITAQKAIELYPDKNAPETITLAEGSKIVFLGSDFRDWILTENVETREQGWLHVKTEENGYAVYCILTDGSEIYCNLLLDGLMQYD